MRIVCVLGLIGCVLSLVLAGCSGGGGSSMTSTGERGKATIEINWPTPADASDRLLPDATQSITVALDNGRGYTALQTVNRDPNIPSNTVQFTGVPEGNITITVTAYSQVDATGTPLSVGKSVTAIFAQQTSTVTVSMNSTIKSVIIAPAPTALENGTGVQLVATAVNAANEIVPVSAGGFAWLSSAPSVATVDDEGRVIALKQGTTRITVIERESGISGYLSLKVTPGQGSLIVVVEDEQVGISLNQSDIELQPGGTFQFTATLTGTPNKFVVWSIVEGEAGGTISQSGLYKAPSVETSSTFHVKVISIADPTKSAMATIHVTAETGGFDFNIH